jgi:hypothetical protein
MRTPILQDKRFILTTGTIAAVLGLVACDKAPNEQVLTFLGLTLAWFSGQSQWGQTKRTTAVGAGPLPIQGKSD